MTRRKFFGLLAAAPLVPLGVAFGNRPNVAVYGVDVQSDRIVISHPSGYPAYVGSIAHPFHSRFALPPEKIAEIYRGVLAAEFGPYDIPRFARALDA